MTTTTETFTDDEIEAAISQHDTPSHPDATTVDDARHLLNQIQASFEAYWSEHLDAIDDDHLRVVHEDSDVLVLADHTGHGWTEELDAAGVDDDVTRAALKSIHHKTACRLCDYSWQASSPFVLAKPDGWSQGEHHVERRVAQLARAADVSTAAALDYWMVEIKGWKQSAWATRAGRGQSTVSESIAKIENGLPGPELS